MVLTLIILKSRALLFLKMRATSEPARHDLSLYGATDKNTRKRCEHLMRPDDQRSSCPSSAMKLTTPMRQLGGKKGMRTNGTDVQTPFSIELLRECSGFRGIASLNWSAPPRLVAANAFCPSLLRPQAMKPWYGNPPTW